MAVALAVAAAVAHLGDSCTKDSDCYGMEKCEDTDGDNAVCACYWSWGTHGDGCYTPGHNFWWYLVGCLIRSLLLGALSVRSMVSLARLRAVMGCSSRCFCSSTLHPVLLIFLASVMGTLQATATPRATGPFPPLPPTMPAGLACRPRGTRG